MQQLVWSDTTIIGNDSKSLIFLKEPKLIVDEGCGATGRKISFYKDVVVLAIPAEKIDLSIVEVLNLTSQFNAIKGLQWKVSKGKKWMIYRMGHASTGRPPHPVPDDLLGKVLEADKMSVEQSTYHWHHVIDSVKKYLGEYIGKSFKHMLIDSYEAGNQTWTPNFREEFIKCKGYDPTPWLLTLGQPITNDSKNTKRRMLDNEEKTKRFEWDYRDVINQLYMDNGFAVGNKVLNDNNLALQWQPYRGPFNTQQGTTMADLPMGEFWSTSNGMIDSNIPATARATGKTIVGAEAFTGRPEVSQSTEDPAFLKFPTNGAYASGVNRLVLHHWVHQPFDDKYQPGMCMGWWGTHFGRYQTWAQSGKAFFDYLSCCQVLLQHGEGVADYLCLDKLNGNADIISKTDFLESKINVENASIILPSGRKYPFLVVTESIITPEVVTKIVELVAAGASVVCPKPIKSPSLQNYPFCDELLKNIGDEIWVNATKNAYGKGFIFKKLDGAKKKFNIMPDFVVEKAVKFDDIKLTYRTASDADIYYVANMSNIAQNVIVSFRIAGIQPELWQAEDGIMRKAVVWSEKSGLTTLSLYLRGQQTVFVVFKKAITEVDHLIEIKTENNASSWFTSTEEKGAPFLCSTDTLKATAVFASGKQKKIDIKQVANRIISGAWNVTFVPKLGSPFQRKFAKLVDFNKLTDKDVMYFAGTATYTKTIRIKRKELGKGKRIVLDLGEMNDLAQMKINNQSVDTLWHPPFKVDITNKLKKGDNKLEISVTNNWVNRLIGDKKEPADFEWGKDRGKKLGRAMKAHPDWFLKNEPCPSQGRKAFTVCYYYRDNSPLQPAGLVGQV